MRHLSGQVEGRTTGDGRERERERERAKERGGRESTRRESKNGEKERFRPGSEISEAGGKGEEECRKRPQGSLSTASCSREGRGIRRQRGSLAAPACGWTPGLIIRPHSSCRAKTQMMQPYRRRQWSKRFIMMRVTWCVFKVPYGCDVCKTVGPKVGIDPTSESTRFRQPLCPGKGCLQKHKVGWLCSSFRVCWVYRVTLECRCCCTHLLLDSD